MYLGSQERSLSNTLLLLFTLETTEFLRVGVWLFHWLFLPHLLAFCLKDNLYKGWCEIAC